MKKGKLTEKLKRVEAMLSNLYMYSLKLSRQKTSNIILNDLHREIVITILCSQQKHQKNEQINPNLYSLTKILDVC